MGIVVRFDGAESYTGRYGTSPAESRTGDGGAATLREKFHAYGCVMSDGIG